MFSNVLAVAALAISVLTFVLSYHATRLAERRSRLPVLVFLYDGKRWLLRNVGNGPALSIIVAQKYTAGEQAGSWYNPVRVPPLARDAEFPLRWLRPARDYSVGAHYRDFLREDVGKRKSRVFTVTCERDRNSVTPGRLMPWWDEEDIRPHWNPPGGDE